MKIKWMGTVIALLFLCTSSYAATFTYVESYTGEPEYVRQPGLFGGVSGIFKFDFVNKVGGDDNTNTSLGLTKDASGMTAEEIWESACIDLTLRDDEGDYEILKLVIKADVTEETFETEKMEIGDSGYGGFLGLERWSEVEDRDIHYDLSAAMMAAFASEGMGTVSISAPDVLDGICQFNDFNIVDITMTVNTYIPDTPNEPVPEPATLLLMGTGLAGLVRYRRKKK